MLHWLLDQPSVQLSHLSPNLPLLRKISVNIHRVVSLQTLLPCPVVALLVHQLHVVLVVLRPLIVQIKALTLLLEETHLWLHILTLGRWLRLRWFNGFLDLFPNTYFMFFNSVCPLHHSLSFWWKLWWNSNGTVWNCCWFLSLLPIVLWNTETTQECWASSKTFGLLVWGAQVWRLPGRHRGGGGGHRSWLSRSRGRRQLPHINWAIRRLPTKSWNSNWTERTVWFYTIAAKEFLRMAESSGQLVLLLTSRGGREWGGRVRRRRGWCRPLIQNEIWLEVYWPAELARGVEDIWVSQGCLVWELGIPTRLEHFRLEFNFSMKLTMITYLHQGQQTTTTATRTARTRPIKITSLRIPRATSFLRSSSFSRRQRRISAPHLSRFIILSCRHWTFSLQTFYWTFQNFQNLIFLQELLQCWQFTQCEA